jgi:DNA-binding MarR family transcriptional regulator
MPSLREIFPFGDIDDDVVARAASRFPAVPEAEIAAGFDFAKAVVDALERLSEVLDDAGLTPARWRLLVSLVVQSDPEGATIGELARHLEVREPTITATVDRLEREGLVERSRHPADGRVVVVRITDAGAHTVATLIPKVAARITDFVTGLGGPTKTRALADRVRSAVRNT